MIVRILPPLNRYVPYESELQLAIPDPSVVGDNASSELVDLARAGDRDGFDALASCLMPADTIAECWNGVRRRLRLS